MDEPISDADLRSRLKSHGFQPGPITETTRSVYLKKLKQLTADAEKNAPPSKVRPTRAVASKTGSNHFAKTSALTNFHTTEQSPLGPAADSSQAKRRPSGRISTPVRQPFKSPDPPRTPFSTSVSSRLSHPIGVPSKISDDSSTSTPAPSHLTRDATPQRGAGHTPTRKTYVYFKNGYSESDTDDDFDRSNSVSNTMSRVAGWLRRTAESTGENDRLASRDSSRRSLIQSASQDDRQLFVSDSDFSDAEGPNTRRRSVVGSRGSVRDTGTATSTSLLLTPPRLLERTPKSPSRPGLSILSDDANPYSRLRTTSIDSEPISSRQKNLFSRLLSRIESYIPNLILLFLTLIVGFLAVNYVVLRDHHGEVGKLADLQRIVCGSAVPRSIENTMDTHQCLHQDKLDEALPMVSNIYDILSRYAGEYHCGSISLASPKMSLRTARNLLERDWLLSQSDLSPFAKIWENALFVILHVGKVHFHIITYGANADELGPKNRIVDIYEFESIRPYFSGLCRLQRCLSWIVNMFLNLIGIVLFLALIGGAYTLTQWIRRRGQQKLEQKNARIRDLVGEIVRMLQQQLRVNESNPTQPPYVPVHLIRDRLRLDHPDSQSLWPELSRYVYDVETSIKVCEWRGIGETWQWQGGTGWQGSALADKSQKPPFVVPPTECVKIRDMFSVDNLDERSKLRIKRELLKKLADCGPILHIGLDSVGSKGLVYVKCADTATAGRVYYAIHANYFDGRLVTVKFLRDTKYCLRFPEAHGLRKPLAVRDLE